MVAQNKRKTKTSPPRKISGKTMAKTRPYREALLEALADPVEAAHYLNAAISDSPEMLLKALRNVAQSRQMTKVAREAGVRRESLYRATSEIGNPTLDTFHSILAAMGIEVEFKAAAGEITSTVPKPSATVVPSGRVKRHARTSPSRSRNQPMKPSPQLIGIGVLPPQASVLHIGEWGSSIHQQPRLGPTMEAGSRLHAMTVASMLDTVKFERTAAPLSLVALASMQQREQEESYAQKAY
jgi:probable addiction module antidote protein